MSKIVIFLLLLSNSALAQDDLDSIEKQIANDKVFQNLSDKAKAISLSDAIEEGLRKNNGEVLRKYEFQLNELSYKDSYDDFYYPKLSLKMNTIEDHYNENLYRDSISNGESARTPNGVIGLGFDDFTVFNWGKDYLEFLNSKEDYQRNKQIYKEKRRELRLLVIINYFKLSQLHQIVRAYKKQLSHTSFIYRLAKEKLGLHKIDSQELLQAKAEFLAAHTFYQDSLYNYYNQQQLLANLIGDDLKTVYRPSSKLRFKPVSIKKTDGLKYVTANKPSILQAKATLKNANRSYQKTLKDNLPLPKFSLKLGSYQKAFSSSGVSDNYETFSGSRNLEIAASLNMTWTIYGSGGFLNSRVTEKSYYQKRIAEINLKETYRESRVANNLTYSRILYLEKKHRAAKAQVSNARKVFDKTIDNYIAGRTKFAEMKDVLQILIDSTIEIENVKYAHLAEKVTYASIMGLNDFPGDRFENLVQK
jgi:outer membrane protein TolC